VDLVEALAELPGKNSSEDNMVNFLPARGFGAGFTQAFPEAFKSSLEEESKRRKEQELLEEESEALQEAGYDVSSKIRDPKIRQQLLEQTKKEKKSLADQGTDQERQKIIGDYLGPNVAKLYSTLTDGGKTQLSNIAIEALYRNQPFEEILKQKLSSSPDEVSEIISSVQQSVSQPNQNISNIPESEQSILASQIPEQRSQKENINEKQSSQEFQFPIVEPPKDKTPKELNSYRENLRKENVPLFKVAGEKSRALKNQEDHLNILDKLSENVPDISRFMVDNQGRLRPLTQMLKLVPKNAERFIKTVNDFITEAKDIFGSRVTNFDLQTFQSRLPSLLNSKEGRSEIIEQMRIFSEMERNYDDALRNVYKHYGLDGISQERAEEIAESMVNDREKQLRDRLGQIGFPQYNLQEKPNASEHTGKVIEDEQGNKFRSNGTEWEKI